MSELKVAEVADVEEAAVRSDVMRIVRSQVSQLIKQAEKRLLAPDEALTLKRYHEILLDCTREKRRDDEQNVDDMNVDDLRAEVAKILGGGR